MSFDEVVSFGSVALDEARFVDVARVEADASFDERVPFEEERFEAVELVDEDFFADDAVDDAFVGVDGSASALAFASSLVADDDAVEVLARPRPRRAAAARAMSPARSGRDRRCRPLASDSSCSTGSPEKNISTGRALDPFSPGSGSVRGWVRVRSSCSLPAGAPAPGMRAPRPRPSPRFCVISSILPKNGRARP